MSKISDYMKRGDKFYYTSIEGIDVVISIPVENINEERRKDFDIIVNKIKECLNTK